MAINDISQYFTLDNGTQIANDSTFASLAANTRIKNKNTGSTFIKNSNYSNVFDRVSTFTEFIKATDFKIATSGSGNAVANISYTASNRTVTQTLTTFATPAELTAASNNLKSQAVGSISVSGRTVTYKNINGQTLGSFQTQDNDTTYSAGTGLYLSGTQFNVTRSTGSSNLWWNTEVTLGTVAGLAIKAKLPANPNISYYAGDGLSLNGTTFSLALTSSHIINALGYTPAKEGAGGGSYNTWYVEGIELKDSYSSSEIWSNLEHQTYSPHVCGGPGSSDYWTLGGSHPVDGTYRCDTTGKGHFSKLNTSGTSKPVTVHFIEVTITKIA